MDFPSSLIIAKIAAGRLPRHAHETASLRCGAGESCHGCGEAVLTSNVEVGVGFSDGAPLRFHVDCFGIWRVSTVGTLRPARDRR